MTMEITHIVVKTGLFKKHKCEYKGCKKRAVSKVMVGENEAYYCLIHRANVLMGLLGIQGVNYERNHK
ncbi:MAG: hypothetical protein ACTSUF_03675 [Candidatus Heimdallarchaeaceae archaeon]